MKNSYLFFALAILLVTLVFTQSLYSQNEPSLNTRKHLKFISEPSRFGQAGIAYSYTAKAVTSDTTAVIRYFTGNQNSDNLTIDSITGVVNWIPSKKGWYKFTLTARSNNGENATQSFTVTVIGGNGIVQGRVTDTLNAGIQNIIIEVLQASNTSTVSLGCYAYFAKTDENGYYRISRIDPGDYKLRAVSPTSKYLSQWFDGKDNPSDADKIIVADTPNVTIADFKLRGGAENRPKITASGLVTDTNFIPLKTANVFFVRSGFALNSKNIDEDYREFFNLNAWKDDFRLEGNSKHVYHTRVDSLGRYSLRLPQGEYIAFSKAPRYATEFYLEQSDLLSATLLKLQKDSAGINFTLALRPPVVLGIMNGSVLDSLKDIGVPSRVIASRDRWTTKDTYNSFRSYVVDTDSLGAFTIDSLLPGSYFVMAVPLGNYAPAFFSTDTASARWKKATRVMVNGNTVNGINIYVREIPAITTGYSSISGTIRPASGSESTISGALVYANRNGEFSGYAVTNENGNYNIDGLAPGTYTVWVDKLGFTETATKSSTVSYSMTGNPITATVDFSINEVTGVFQTSNVQPTQFMLEQNFPNPFNPSTTIEYALNQSGIVTLKVYNLLGQEVRTLVNGFQNAGSYHATFSAQGLSSGIYFYRLQSENNIQTRKMILLQ